MVINGMLRWQAIHPSGADWPDLPAGAVSERVNWLSLGPQENYPDRLTAACLDRWDLPLSDMYTRRLPERKRSALRTRIELWPTPVARRLQFNISRYSQ